MWKQFISSYFNFTKRDRRGVWVLFCLIIAGILLPYFYPYFIHRRQYDHGEFEKAIASLREKEADSTEGVEPGRFNRPSYPNDYRSSPGKYAERGQSKGELFYFDPNTASNGDWKRLGIRDKTIATIQNYLSKGGKFYKKEDIGKIWGLHADEIERLVPYVKIASPAKNDAIGFSGQRYEKKEYVKPVYSVVDINLADSASLTALPGIGSKLSQRILRFRDRLGGFYKVAQIGETFGLPDSTFQKIKAYLKIGDNQLKQININTATTDEMKAHPYIRYVLANAIMQYRAQHGNYKSVEEVKKLMLVTDSIFNKAAPYLTVN